MAAEKIEQIEKVIRRNSRFAVTSHARPDGDSLGSALGLALSLQRLGKNAQVVSADPAPHAYRNLPAASEIQVCSSLKEDYDAVFVLECNNLARPEIKGLDRQPVINIDHHPESEPFGAINWIDTRAAAVGELIFQLIDGLGVSLTPEIATNLYVALLTDTGSFQFSNTTAATFAIASRLVEGGADPGRISQQIYMQQPLTKVLLLSRVLQTLEMHSSGRIAHITATREMATEVGADLSETEGIVNHPLSIEGVSLVAFFREGGPDLFRVSLRAKDEHDVSRVARHFGGGGHPKAAGLTVEAPYSRTVKLVLSELEKLLKASK